MISGGEDAFRRCRCPPKIACEFVISLDLLGHRAGCRQSFTPNWLWSAPAFVLWARRASSTRDLNCARISLTVIPTIIYFRNSKLIQPCANSSGSSQVLSPLSRSTSTFANSKTPSNVLGMLPECVQRRAEPEAFLSALCHSTCHRRREDNCRLLALYPQTDRSSRGVASALVSISQALDPLFSRVSSRFADSIHWIQSLRATDGVSDHTASPRFRVGGSERLLQIGRAPWVPVPQPPARFPARRHRPPPRPPLRRATSGPLWCQ